MPAGATKLSLKSITFKEACDFIAQHHRHHKPPQGWKFGTSVVSEGSVRGVVIVGRPVARGNDDGETLEVTRLCTDGTKNVASMLYGAAWRAARALGYKRLITYTLSSEEGVSVKAAGWRKCHQVRGRSWDTPSRRRTDKHPTVDKTMWQIEVGE